MPVLCGVGMVIRPVPRSACVVDRLFCLAMDIGFRTVTQVTPVLTPLLSCSGHKFSYRQTADPCLDHCCLAVDIGFRTVRQLTPVLTPLLSCSGQRFSYRQTADPCLDLCCLAVDIGFRTVRQLTPVLTSVVLQWT